MGSSADIGLITFLVPLLVIAVLVAIPILIYRRKKKRAIAQAEMERLRLKEEYENKTYKDILLENNLGDYESVFSQNKLTDISVISELDDADLEKIGIEVMGDRKKILKVFSDACPSFPEPPHGKANFVGLGNRQRHGCVTTWLVIMIVGHSFSIVIGMLGTGFGALVGADTGQTAILTLLTVINIAFIVCIFCWQIIGFYGLVATTVIGAIINFNTARRMDQAISSLPEYFGGGAGTSNFMAYSTLFWAIISILVLFAVLNIKKDGYSTWDHLRGKKRL